MYNIFFIQVYLNNIEAINATPVWYQVRLITSNSKILLLIYVYPYYYILILNMETTCAFNFNISRIIQCWKMWQWWIVRNFLSSLSPRSMCSCVCTCSYIYVYLYTHICVLHTRQFQVPYAYRDVCKRMWVYIVCSVNHC